MNTHIHTEKSYRIQNIDIGIDVDIDVDIYIYTYLHRYIHMTPLRLSRSAEWKMLRTRRRSRGRRPSTEAPLLDCWGGLDPVIVRPFNYKGLRV